MDKTSKKPIRAGPMVVHKMTDNPNTSSNTAIDTLERQTQLWFNLNGHLKKII